jgi:IS5 family transposase
MTTFNDFLLKTEYKKVQKLKSKLDEINSLIDWTEFKKLFPKKENNFGRPKYDRVFLSKILILQNLYNLSDEETEYQIYDRLSFRQFLGFPKNIPDYSTIWKFREELINLGIEDQIFDEFLRQIRTFDYEVKEGKIQDATFVQAPCGKTKPAKDERSRETSKTSRSRDGTWTKKNSKSVFGFKNHVKIERGSKLIETLAVTTAKVHDNNIDLAEKDEIMYRDRGYSGSKTKARGDATMKLGKLTIKQKLRNKRISKKRSEGEHPFGTIHSSMNGGKTKLTTISRVYVQQLFVCIGYNLRRLTFLARS